MKVFVGGSIGYILRTWKYKEILRGISSKVLMLALVLRRNIDLGIKKLKELIYHLKQSLKKEIIHLERLNLKKGMVGRGIKLDMKVYMIGLKRNLVSQERVNIVERLKRLFITGLISTTNTIVENYQIGNVFA